MNKENHENLTHEHKHDTHTRPPTPEYTAREDEATYADDAKLILEHDATIQLTRKLLNYHRITNTTNAGINWGGVHIVTRKREYAKLIKSLKRPLGNIKMGAAGKIHGEKGNIHMQGNQAVA